jgi:hypothetical protein
MDFATLNVRAKDGVLVAEIAATPMNLLALRNRCSSTRQPRWRSQRAAKRSPSRPRDLAWVSTH